MPAQELGLLTWQQQVPQSPGVPEAPLLLRQAKGEAQKD